jgi:hypothetical protein
MNYIGSKYKLSSFIKTVISDIVFCLNTRNKVVNKDLDEGKEYFNKNYEKIIKYIKEKNIEKLKQIIYSSPGVGQKIGSMLLEFIYLYTKYYDEDIIKVLFLPIDTHIKRVFYNSFKVETPNIRSRYTDRKYLQFQYLLDRYSNNIGHSATLHSHAHSRHIFAVAGMLRIPLSQPQKCHIQPERYTKC